MPMAKRRADDAAPVRAPGKRRRGRPLCSVDLRLETTASPGGEDPPSLLALWGGHCRKRPHFDRRELPEEPVPARLSVRGSAEPAAGSGNFQGGVSCAGTRGKRPREQEGPHADASTQSTAEDCAFNSFQFWRTPLPELDLSLLEDAALQPKVTDKPTAPDSSLEPMDT